MKTSDQLRWERWKHTFRDACAFFWYEATPFIAALVIWGAAVLVMIGGLFVLGGWLF